MQAQGTDTAWETRPRQCPVGPGTRRSPLAQHPSWASEGAQQVPVEVGIGHRGGLD